jgi:hypothetical protein
VLREMIGRGRPVGHDGPTSENGRMARLSGRLEDQESLYEVRRPSLTFADGRFGIAGRGWRGEREWQC